MENETNFPFSGGVPKLEQYHSLMETRLYLEMRNFSRDFAKQHRQALRDYQWLKDSFHHWSRQLEYPFVFDFIERFRGELSNFVNYTTILDAGSGCTFFPYFILKNLERTSVYACDSDPTLMNIFAKINAVYEKGVDFQRCYLQHLNL